MPPRLYGDKLPRRLRLTPWQTRAALLGAIAATLLGAYLRLPGNVPVPAASTAGAQQAAAAAPVAEEPPPLTEAQQAERRRARRLAQDAAEPLNVAHRQLLALHPARWNPRATAAAEQLLQAGEQAHLAQDYAAALALHQRALAALTALQQEGRARRASALAAAGAALERADGAAAASALDLARRIHDGADVQRLDRRLQVLPSVLAALERGIAARAIEDFELAATAFAAALRLDPATARARSALAEVERARAQQRFMAVMNRGFSALQQAEYDTAQAAFTQASGVAPSNVATGTALQQLRANALVDRLQNIQQQADRLLNGELFAAALALYRQALDTDPSLAFAQQGAALARERGEAARQLDDALAHPERLSSDAVLAASEALLRRSATLQGVGPQLQSRIDRLRALLAAASRPVDVQLHSDNLTEVRVYRVGAIGRFGSRALSLRPGRYTVSGTRDGYRDERLEVDVRPGMPPVDIRCREPI